MPELDTGLTPEEILKIYDQQGVQVFRSAPKPIVVIYLPDFYSFDGNRSNPAMELMRALNNNFGMKDPESKREYPDYWTQYYWFCFTKNGIEAPEFQVFHPKDFTDIQFQELKDMVMADLETMKLNHQSK